MSIDARLPPRGNKPVPESLASDLAALGVDADSYDFVPLSVMQKAIARRLTESFRDVPHFSLLAKIEVNSLIAGREKVNSQLVDARLSLNDLLVKAAALALMKCPAVNVSYTPQGIIYHHAANIAVAVAVPGGLVTPVIRAAEDKTLAKLSSEIKDLAERGRKKALMPSEYVGGTFSISNLGMFGIANFNSIINPPQACILSVGAAEAQIKINDGATREVQVMNMTLTCDHRAVDGATGANWLKQFKALIEEPDGWIQASLN